MGLAGKPDLLGRAKKPSEFIKHMRDFAVIEIELCDGGEGKNLTVKRRINQTGASKWWLNGTEIVNIQILIYFMFKNFFFFLTSYRQKL